MTAAPSQTAVTAGRVSPCLPRTSILRRAATVAIEFIALTGFLAVCLTPLLF